MRRSCQTSSRWLRYARHIQHRRRNECRPIKSLPLPPRLFTFPICKPFVSVQRYTVGELFVGLIERRRQLSVNYFGPRRLKNVWFASVVRLAATRIRSISFRSRQTAHRRRLRGFNRRKNCIPSDWQRIVCTARRPVAAVDRFAAWRWRMCAARSAQRSA